MSMGRGMDKEDIVFVVTHTHIYAVLSHSVMSYSLQPHGP